MPRRPRTTRNSATSAKPAPIEAAKQDDKTSEASPFVPADEAKAEALKVTATTTEAVAEKKAVTPAKKPTAATKAAEKDAEPAPKADKAQAKAAKPAAKKAAPPKVEKVEPAAEKPAPAAAETTEKVVAEPKPAPAKRPKAVAKVEPAPIAKAKRAAPPAKAEKPAVPAKAADGPAAEKPAAKPAKATAKKAAPKAEGETKPATEKVSPAPKTAERAAKASATAPEKAEAPKASPAPAPKAEAKAASTPEPKEAERAPEEPKAAPKPADEATPTAKPAPKATAKPKAAARKPAPKAEPTSAAAPVPAPVTEEKPSAEPAPAKATAPAPKPKEEAVSAPQPEKPAPARKAPEAAPTPAPAPLPQPRRSVAFIGSECYPFVKTGGLGDVMYALPKALVKLNCDVKVILPRYACIKQEWQEKMTYKGAFQMDLCSDGRSYYVGIMEYVSPEGVVYDFIDNNDFFSYGNPYTNLVDDIPRYCYFSKAALAALNYLDWTPDVIHCHDWQAALVPLYLKTMFQGTPLGRSRVVLTIHNLRFQGKYNIPTIRYWTNLPSYVFNEGALQQDWTEANILKGGLAYADMITTVSGTYAWEIQSPEYGEGLDAHLRYHAGKLRGIVNGIDTDIWNPAADTLIAAPYDVSDAVERKHEDKRALQEELGLEQDDGKMVIGLISRLTDQKGLDLVNAIIPDLIDGNTQVVVLGTGEPRYEDSFRYYENRYKGTVCSNIMYDEARSHQIYAGADALLVPSRFEPCGLTQLIAMHYGTVPIVRETGGLKDTVQPYNKYSNEGNGFTFDRYDAGLLLDAINRAKTLFFTNRWCWDQMVQRDMAKDVSWENSARQYRQLYLELTQ